LKDVREMDGHYYAAIKTDKGWLRFDDEDVTITTE
jgi:ubiquitin C-terminal hydrolase